MSISCLFDYIRLNSSFPYAGDQPLQSPERSRKRRLSHINARKQSHLVGEGAKQLQSQLHIQFTGALFPQHNFDPAFPYDLGLAACATSCASRDVVPRIYSEALKGN